MWTSSVAIPLQQAIEWYSRTTVWKWLPSWAVTTEPSGGSNPGRSCLIGSPHHRFLAGDPRLDYVDTFTLLGDAMHPTFGHPKTLAGAYDHVYYEGREIGKPTAEREEVRRPVREGVLGGVRPNCTPALHTDADRL